jgi:WD40 repeat protein
MARTGIALASWLWLFFPICVASRAPAEKRRPAPLLSINTRPSFVGLVEYSPDDVWLVTRTASGRAVLWDATTGKQLLSLGEFNELHNNPLAISPDGKHLAGISTSKTVNTWDTKNGKRLFVLQGGSEWIQDVAFSPNARYLASCLGDGGAKPGDGVVIRDARTGKAVSALRTPDGPVTRLAWTPDSRRLVTGGFNGEVHLWELASRSIALTLATSNKADVERLTFARDGRRLAASYGIGKRLVRIWELPSGKEVATFRLWSGLLKDAALSPDGDRLAATVLHFDREKGMHRGDLILWDVATCEIKALLPYGAGQAAYRVAWSHDGTRLAAAHGENGVKVWSVKDLLEK